MKLDSREGGNAAFEGTALTGRPTACRPSSA